MEEPSDSLFNVLSSLAWGCVALPLHQGVANILTTLWQTPASRAPISKKVERRYFVPAKGHEYLYSHPAPNSLVVESVNHWECHGPPTPAPKDKDAGRLDSFGRKVYSSVSFQLRVANHQALLSHYDLNLWRSLLKFEPLLPERDKKQFKALVEEEAEAMKAAFQASLDAADTAARSTASAICTHRVSWLLLSGLSAESQSLMQGLPFDGKVLFADETDVRLHGMKDSRTTLQTLGLYVLPAKDKPRLQTSAPPARGRYEPPPKRLREQRRRSLEGQEAGRGGFDSLGGATGPVAAEAPQLIKFVFCNRLSAFRVEWSHIALDQWILSTISRGYMLQFTCLPLQHPQSWEDLGKLEHVPLLSQEVQLLDLGVVERVPVEFQGVPWPSAGKPWTYGNFA
ncbi:uncharacterized protein LOC127040291 [Gopherus flavomarginatus]|uniref:uncharacterized protein LOC127040291 n=1 Tax=Gopherus flavomarginatus TaxID=286002 RepID=UPI0021CC4943|nr:uncharacterized protein LOC127040291 [Gopherus flavomarginatus]